MDTTMTRKTEALALLALDEMTWLQRIALNILTAKQAGYEAEITTGGYMLNAPRCGIQNNHVYPSEDAAWEASPEFCTSVDACLTLPKPERYRWLIASSTEGADTAGRALLSMGFKHDVIMSMLLASTPSLAMLKAWWEIQVD